MKTKICLIMLAVLISGCATDSSTTATDSQSEDKEGSSLLPKETSSLIMEKSQSRTAESNNPRP